MRDTDLSLFDAQELQGIRSVAFIVLDSLRWDSFERANTPFLDRWAPRQSRRYSYASWTLPSHTCLLSGLLPHTSPKGVLAAATYIADHSLWSYVLGNGPDAKRHLSPEYWLPLMAQRCGWKSIGRVSMPILNEKTAFSRNFDEYMLSPLGSNLGAQIESVASSVMGERAFVFINASDTHYPYLMPKASMPRISGINGALFRTLETSGEETVQSLHDIPFTPEDMRLMHASQVRAVELADKRLSYLVDLLEKPLFLLVVSDHGELFGEEGYFGHGPFFHPLLFEVPLAAGVIR